MNGHSSKRFWDAAARKNAAWHVATRFTSESEPFFASGERDVDEILARAGLSLGATDTLLELGSGVGRMTRYFAQRAGQVIAADVSAEMLRHARENLAELENIEYLEVSGEGDIPIPDSSVDAVFSYITLQHVPTASAQERYFAESVRILRPGGWAFLQFGHSGVLSGLLDGAAHVKHLLRGHNTLSRAWSGARLDERMLDKYSSQTVRIDVLPQNRRHVWVLVRKEPDAVQGDSNVVAGPSGPQESAAISRHGSRVGRKNPLRDYFASNRGRLIHKWDHYFDIYHRHLSQFRRKRVTLLEIGVFHGGSLQMWKKYFGRKASIIGLDVDERTRSLAEPQIEIVIGDQGDRAFLQKMRSEFGPFDIVIDDGGHTMEQQIRSFEELWPAVKDGGVYVVEDLHTSYWDEYGGGHLRQGTFIEYAKRLIDAQHAWHAREGDGLDVDDFTRSLRGMHVYDSVIVFDKARVGRPYASMTGTPSFPL
jgi:SAM-dependent methyltransferase